MLACVSPSLFFLDLLTLLLTQSGTKVHSDIVHHIIVTGS